MFDELETVVNKIHSKINFYLHLDRDINNLHSSLQTLNDLIHRPPWLPLFNQDRFRHMEILEKKRHSATYKQAFSNKEPLISVRIATYNNSKELLERAIPSVLNQTYNNWEIVIIGDYCTDDTKQKITALKNSRIKFIELSYHYNYPKDKIHRWMAQGLLAHNEAIKHCSGDWIAPLDDDNEFLPYHLEELLRKAQKEQLELVYGNMISIDRKTNKKWRVGGFPPEVGNFDFSASLYHRVLGIFPFDINSYLYEEVGDTNLIRRLKESGVRMGFVNKYVTKYYFRQPGSIREEEIYPQQKNTYDVLASIKQVPGDISLAQADLLTKSIEDSSGHIAIVGNHNKKITAFVKELCGKKIILIKNFIEFKKNTQNMFDLIIVNLSESEEANYTSELLAAISSGGVLFFVQKIPSTRKQLDVDPVFQILQDGLWMKI